MLAGLFSKRRTAVASNLRFGKKLKVPSTVQIKHQLLLFWLRHQMAKESAEAVSDEELQVANPLHVHEASF